MLILSKARDTLTCFQVGQAIIQTSKQLGYKTINFVRNRYVSCYNQYDFPDSHRPDYPQLKQYLTDLGADHVFTYDELLDPSFKKKFESLRTVYTLRCLFSVADS